MTDFSVKYNLLKKEKNEIIFDIEGNKKYGLDKSIVNAIRRNLLTRINSISLNSSDITVVKNTTPLHNEFLKDRLSLVPLNINPETYDNDYLLELSIINRDVPVYDVTTENINIYPVLVSTKELIDKQKKSDFVPEDENIYNKIKEDPKEYFNMDQPLDRKQKDKIFNPFMYNKKKYYILLTYLKLNNSEEDFEEINLYSVPVIGNGYKHARFNNVSKSIYTFKINNKLLDQEFKKHVKINKIKPKDRKEEEKSFNIANSERYYHRDIFQEPYFYEFTIKSNHIFTPSELFTKSIEILLEDFVNLKNKINKINKVDDYQIATIENVKTNVFKIKLLNEDYSTITILQAYSSRYFIDDKSLISVFGYNKHHPLEDIMVLNIMIMPNDYEEIQQVNYIIEFIINAIDRIDKDLNLLRNKWNIN